MASRERGEGRDAAQHFTKKKCGEIGTASYSNSRASGPVEGIQQRRGGGEKRVTVTISTNP